MPNKMVRACVRPLESRSELENRKEKEQELEKVEKSMW